MATEWDSQVLDSVLSSADANSAMIATTAALFHNNLDTVGMFGNALSWTFAEVIALILPDRWYVISRLITLSSYFDVVRILALCL